MITEKELSENYFLLQIAGKLIKDKIITISYETIYMDGSSLIDNVSKKVWK